MDLKILIIIAACLLAAISVSIIITPNNYKPENKTSENTLISTEDYINNCSNNWTFIKCDWKRNIDRIDCTADGKPINITGLVSTK